MNSADIRTGGSAGYSAWTMLLAGSLLLIYLVAALMLPRNVHPSQQSGQTVADETGDSVGTGRANFLRPSTIRDARSAQGVMAEKLAKFVRKRRELVHAMAEHAHARVSNQVEQFFDALDMANWDKAQVIFERLKQ